MRIRPLLYGYQVVRVTTSRADAARDTRALRDFAERENYSLAHIFVDSDPNRPCSALAAMIAAARRTEATAVVVPSVLDLGLLPAVQSVTRRMIEREADVRLFVALPVGMSA